MGEMGKRGTVNSSDRRCTWADLSSQTIIAFPRTASGAIAHVGWSERPLLECRRGRDVGVFLHADFDSEPCLPFGTLSWRSST
jgi:hypothetical protein